MMERDLSPLELEAETECDSQCHCTSDPIHLSESERELVWRVFAQDRKNRAERELAALPAKEVRHRKRRALPSLPQTTGSVHSLAGIETSEWVSCMEVLPGGDRAVTVTDVGKLRMSSVGDGKLLWEVDAHDACQWFGHTLALLGDRSVVSCGWKDDRVRVWDLETGDALGDIHVGGGGVSTLVTIDRQRVAVGCESGDIIFCKQAERGRLEETARVAADDKHSCKITACSACGERLASASSDGMVAVWDLETQARLAELGGHNGAVTCVDMSDSIVVTGCVQAPHVRVFCAANNYSCVSTIGAVDWVHDSWVHSVHILDSDRIMSVSSDRTIAISAVESNEVDARVQLDSYPLGTAVLPDGSIAVCVMGVKAAILPAPPAATSLLQAYGGSRHRTRSGG